VPLWLFVVDFLLFAAEVSRHRKKIFSFKGFCISNPIKKTYNILCALLLL
jgi:hypothetical protein